MDIEIEILNDMCRICLKQDETVINSIDDWIEIMQNISQTDITIDPEFPEKICDDCTHQLVAANDIRNLIIQSNTYFAKVEHQIVEVDEKALEQIAYEQEQISFDDNYHDADDDEVLQDVEEPATPEIICIEEHLDTEIRYDIDILDVKYTRCCICAITCPNIDDLKEHCAVEHDRQILLFSKEDEEVSSKGGVRCFVCGRIFYAVDTILRHRSCGHCTKGFATSETLLIHQQKKACTDDSPKRKLPIQPRPKMHGCCKCPDMFQTFDELQKHFEIEHAENKYFGEDLGQFSCKLCTEPFQNKGDLQRHYKNPRIKTYTCTQCNKTLASFPKYKAHIETAHGPTQEFPCDKCDKIYDRLDSLRYHKYMLHNEKNVYTCEDCGKVFHKRISFREHRNIHLGLRPHVCAICQHDFTSTGALRTHMRSHTGAKPFKCKYCPKAYSHYSDMKRHSYNHTGEYPYICETCNKGFGKRSAFNTHKATHETK